VPVIQLAKAKGLSNQQLAHLKQELDALAKNLIGQVRKHILLTVFAVLILW
jgi:hypothetical protein